MDERVLISNVCYSQRLGWRVRPVGEGLLSYPQAERDPKLAVDVLTLQRDNLKVQNPNGVLGPETMRAMVRIVLDWQARGSPQTGEIGQTLIRRLILPGVEEAPMPHLEVDCQQAFAENQPFGPQKSSSGLLIGAGLLVGVLGLALYVSGGLGGGAPKRKRKIRRPW